MTAQVDVIASTTVKADGPTVVNRLILIQHNKYDSYEDGPAL